MNIPIGPMSLDFSVGLVLDCKERLLSAEKPVVVNFLYMCVLVAQLSLILYDLMDCSLPGSSVYAILQARILE